MGFCYSWRGERDQKKKTKQAYVHAHTCTHIYIIPQRNGPVLRLRISSSGDTSMK